MDILSLCNLQCSRLTHRLALLLSANYYLRSHYRHPAAVPTTFSIVRVGNALLRLTGWRESTLI
jgi:hypothetical protein